MTSGSVVKGNEEILMEFFRNPENTFAQKISVVKKLQEVDIDVFFIEQVQEELRDQSEYFLNDHHIGNDRKIELMLLLNDTLSLRFRDLNISYEFQNDLREAFSSALTEKNEAVFREEAVDRYKKDEEFQKNLRSILMGTGSLDEKAQKIASLILPNSYSEYFIFDYFQKNRVRSILI